MAELPFHLTARQAGRITLEFIGLLVLTSVAVMGVSQLGYRILDLPSSSGGVWGLAVANTLACLWTLRRALRRHHGSWAQLAVWRVQPAGLIAPFLLLSLGTSILIGDVGNAVDALVPAPAWIRDMFRQLTDAPQHPFGSFAALVIVAPLTEESIFRGVILRGLLGENRPWRAIVLSSSLFAVMHLNPWQFPVAFALGLLFGWVYLRTRSLGLCLAGHALHNGIVYLAASLPFEIPGFNSEPPPGQFDFQPWWFNLCGLVLFAIGVAWFRRSAPPARSFLGIPPEIGANSPPTPPLEALKL